MDDFLDVSKGDFGFTFEDENNQSLDDLDKMQIRLGELEEELEERKRKHRELVRKVSNLLHNLKANPEKPIIKWPNRAKDIDNFLKEIQND